MTIIFIFKDRRHNICMICKWQNGIWYEYLEYICTHKKGIKSKGSKLKYRDLWFEYFKHVKSVAFQIWVKNENKYF